MTPILRHAARALAASGLLCLLAAIYQPFAAPAGGDAGITAEEFQRISPGAPIGVVAEVLEGRVMLFWEMPPMPPASARPMYDPVIDHFRVYRISAGQTRVLVAETRGTFVELEPMPAGTMRSFAVTAVQRSGHESDLSAEAAVRFP